MHGRMAIRSHGPDTDGCLDHFFGELSTKLRRTLKGGEDAVQVGLEVSALV